MPMKSFWFPLLVSIFSATAIVTSYIIAASQGHVYSVWPYISDSAMAYPERNIFAQLFNMAAFLAKHIQIVLKFNPFIRSWRKATKAFRVISVYIRYLVVDAVSQAELTLINKISTILGVTSVSSLTLIANFQQNLADYVHMTGAALMFGLGTIFVVMDTFISFKIKDKLSNGQITAYARCTVSIILVLFVGLFIIGKAVSENKWIGSYDHVIYWIPSSPGYSVHLLGSISEWVMALMIISYFLTLAHEFRHYSLTMSVEVTTQTFIDLNSPLGADGGAQEPAALYRAANSQESVTIWNDTSTEKTPLYPAAVKLTDNKK